MAPRVLELYAGIGGVAAAVSGRASIVAALDQSPLAVRTYRENFPHPAYERNLVHVTDEDLATWGADLWWLSPPCQPYTQKGARRDLDDPRAESFLVLLDRIASVRPSAIGFENVPGFVGSRAHARLVSTVTQAGYAFREGLLCPTSLGVPAKRLRYYLVASQSGVSDWSIPERSPRRLSGYLRANPAPDLYVDPAFVKTRAHVLTIVDAADPTAIASCFTSAYGRANTRSGAYLRTEAGVRRFSPEEILALLGFPADFHFPAGLSRQKAWALVGNSLSVDAVRCVLGAICGMA